MNDTWTPTKGNVHTRRTKSKEKTTVSGIVIPANERKNHERVLIDAEVIAIGAEVTEVQVGDRVLFPRYEAYGVDGKHAREADEFFVAEKFIYGKLSPEANLELGEADSVTIHA